MQYLLRNKVNKLGSGANLAKKLNLTQVTPESILHRLETGDIIVNWGSANKGYWLNKAERLAIPILNHPIAVNRCGSKVLTFKKLLEAGIPCLEFTERKTTAEAWLENGYGVFVRHLVRGSTGKGIEIVRPESGELPDAPLYTKQERNQEEWRLHVINGRVVDICLKKKMGKEKREARGIETVHPYIKTNGNGWVFARQHAGISNSHMNLAISATEALEIDFGCVDTIYNGEEYLVCEVNSAPSLSDKNTMEVYEKGIKLLIDQDKQNQR